MKEETLNKNDIHICTKCKKEFKEYAVYVDCHCNDGGDENGLPCIRCGGSGSDDSLEKTHCKECRRQYSDEYY